MSAKMPTDEGSHASGDEGTPESTPESELKLAEKNEEAKLKAKYPQALRPGVSGFLQKRLQKGQKYFDSGDYNMAKAKGQKPRATVPVVSQLPTGEAIPTPDNLPARKTSMVQSKLATELSS